MSLIGWRTLQSLRSEEWEKKSGKEIKLETGPQVPANEGPCVPYLP